MASEPTFIATSKSVEGESPIVDPDREKDQCQIGQRPALVDEAYWRRAPDSKNKGKHVGIQDRRRRFVNLCAAVMAVLALAGCRQGAEPAAGTLANAPAQTGVPESLPMGGSKSVTRFFVTSSGTGKGGDLGGLAGADARCLALAEAQGAGDHTWRAYLSTSATVSGPAVNARDRIGSGPWYNAEGSLVAAHVEQLHGGANRINKETAVTERLDTVNGAGGTPNMHDIPTGSTADGMAFEAKDDLTCGNWTSSTSGRAQVGHHDRAGQGAAASSWNSAHASRGCGPPDLQATGGVGLFYCFATD